MPSRTLVSNLRRAVPLPSPSAIVLHVPIQTEEMKAALATFTALSALVWHTTATTTVINQTALLDAFSRIPSCGVSPWPPPPW